MSVQAAREVGRVADTIEKFGWLQGTFGAPGMGFCVMGAAHFVSASRAAVQAIAADLPGANTRCATGCCDTSDSNIARWNDTYGRTKVEVVKHLRSVEQRLLAEATAPVVVDEPKAEAVEVNAEKPTFNWSDFKVKFEAFAAKAPKFIAASPPKPKPEPAPEVTETKGEERVLVGV